MAGQSQEKQISFPLAVASTRGVSFDCPQLSMNGEKAVNSMRFLDPCFSTQVSSALSTEELLCTELTKQEPHVFESWPVNFQAYLALQKMKFKALILQTRASACEDHEMMRAVEPLLHKR